MIYLEINATARTGFFFLISLFFSSITILDLIAKHWTSLVIVGLSPVREIERHIAAAAAAAAKWGPWTFSRVLITAINHSTVIRGVLTQPQQSTTENKMLTQLKHAHLRIFYTHTLSIIIRTMLHFVFIFSLGLGTNINSQWIIHTEFISI